MNYSIWSITILALAIATHIRIVSPQHGSYRRQLSVMRSLARKAFEHGLRINEEAACARPRPELIYLTDRNKIYLPRATLLHRCSDQTGCCAHATQTCAATRMQPVTLYFFSIGGDSHYSAARMRQNQNIEKLQFINHTACGCVPLAMSAESGIGVDDVSRSTQSESLRTTNETTKSALASRNDPRHNSNGAAESDEANEEGYNTPEDEILLEQSDINPLSDANQLEINNGNSDDERKDDDDRYGNSGGGSSIGRNANSNEAALPPQPETKYNILQFWGKLLGLYKAKSLRDRHTSNNHSENEKNDDFDQQQQQPQSSPPVIKQISSPNSVVESDTAKFDQQSSSSNVYSPNIAQYPLPTAASAAAAASTATAGVQSSTISIPGSYRTSYSTYVRSPYIQSPSRFMFVPSVAGTIPAAYGLLSHSHQHSPMSNYVAINRARSSSSFDPSLATYQFTY